MAITVGKAGKDSQWLHFFGPPGVHFRLKKWAQFWAQKMGPKSGPTRPFSYWWSQFRGPEYGPRFRARKFMIFYKKGLKQTSKRTHIEVGRRNHSSCRIVRGATSVRIGCWAVGAWSLQGLTRTMPSGSRMSCRMCASARCSVLLVGECVRVTCAAPCERCEQQQECS